MNILVLGGTYFIGKILVELLLSLNHSVSVLNRGTRPPINSGVVSIMADRQDHTMIENALRGKKFDVAIDLSGYKKK